MNKIDNVRMFCAIQKSQAEDDGTIRVWGVASTDAVDSDGETVTADAMRKALPGYMEFGNVREMHRPSAVGKALEIEVQDDGRTMFCAHIVDPVAVKKVQAGVYSGFSIGGSATERDKDDRNIIKGIRLTEISLVDRPANPEAKITMFKGDDVKDENEIDLIADALSKGEVQPGQLLKYVQREAKISEVLTKYAGENLQDSRVALACLVALSDLLLGEESEAAEGEHPEASQQVAALRTAISSLKAFIAAEIMEEDGEKEQEGDQIEMAEGSGDIQKAGARFSEATKSALSELHETVQKCNDHLNKLGYLNDSEKSDSESSLQKAEIAKGLDTIAKLESDLKAKDDALAKSEARVKELEAMPAPSKLEAAAVAKEGGKPKEEFAEELAKMTPIEAAVALQKMQIEQKTRQ